MKNTERVILLLIYLVILQLIGITYLNDITNLFRINEF